MKSLRQRLALSIGISTLLIVSSASTAVWYFEHSTLNELLNDRLKHTAESSTRRVIYEYIRHIFHKREQGKESTGVISSDRTHNRLPYIFFDASENKILFHSSAIAYEHAQHFIQHSQLHEHVDCIDSEGIPWRLYRNHIDAQQSNRGRRGSRDQFKLPHQAAVIFASPLSEINKQEQELAIALILVSIISSFISAITAGFISATALRPLSELRSSIEKIQADDLHERIFINKKTKELNPIVQCLNEALERLETAFDREKRLTADLAHELRTPLAVIRSELDQIVADENYDDALTNAKEAALNMQRLAERILLLARLEAGTQQIQSSAIDLSDEIDSSWQRQSTLSNERHLTLTHTIPLSMSMQTDGALLRMVIDNVLGNAACYADQNTSISVDIKKPENNLELMFTNTYTNDKSIDCTAIFTPYWQFDDARSNTESHAGLGLALVSRMMTAMGGTVSASHDCTQSQFSITLTWPINLIEPV